MLSGILSSSQIIGTYYSTFRHEDESVELYDGDHADIVFSNEQDEPNTNG